MNQELIELGQLITEAEDIAVLVPDLFRGVASPGDNVVFNIYHNLFSGNVDQKQMDADAEAALAWVKAKPEVDANVVFSGPGFCFGGSQSLLFAMRHEVSATITLY